MMARNALIFYTGMLALLAVGACNVSSRATDSADAPPETGNQVATDIPDLFPDAPPSAPANREATLPPLLQVTRDSKDPALFVIRVRPMMEGAVLVSAVGGPFRWVEPPPEKPHPMTPDSGDLVCRLRVNDSTTSATRAGTPQTVQIVLQLFDANGQSMMNITEPLPSAAPGSSDGGKPPRNASSDAPTSLGGVRAIVPKDAPLPRAR